MTDMVASATTTPEEPETPTGQAVLPFYIVCDESGSMHPYLDLVHDALRELHATIAGDPLVSDKCRVGLIAFAEDVKQLLPLTKLSDVVEMPGLTSGTVTNYAEVFRFLKQQIRQNIDDLKDQGLRVYRPVIFFISDGVPTDDGLWQPAYKDLIDPSGAYPHIIAFGIEDAVSETIGQIGTKAAFIQDHGRGIGAGTALREILNSLTNTIVNSSNRAEPTLVIPPAPDGTVEVPLEVVT